MSLVMYERLGHEDRRPSPFSWRIRYALAHKGVPVEFRLVRFADVATIRALSGQHMVPILCEGDRVIHDSWNIACYLEDRFSDQPSLFGGAAGRGLARLTNHWSDTVLAPAVEDFKDSARAALDRASALVIRGSGVTADGEPLWTKIPAKLLRERPSVNPAEGDPLPEPLEVLVRRALEAPPSVSI